MSVRQFSISDYPRLGALLAFSAARPWRLHPVGVSFASSSALFRRAISRQTEVNHNRKVIRARDLMFAPLLAFSQSPKPKNYNKITGCRLAPANLTNTDWLVIMLRMGRTVTECGPTSIERPARSPQSQLPVTTASSKEVRVALTLPGSP